MYVSTFRSTMYQGLDVLTQRMHGFFHVLTCVNDTFDPWHVSQT